MIIKQPQVRIVTKPVTLDNGEAALAYFALVTIEGQVEVRFLGTKTIESAQTAPVLLLENKKVCEFGCEDTHTFSVQPSPFFQSIELLWNQLARAPSLN